MPPAPTKPRAPQVPAPNLPPAKLKLTIQGKGLSRDDETPRKIPKIKVESELEKLIVKLQNPKTDILGDQRRKLVSSMGCYSNPGGPGC